MSAPDFAVWLRQHRELARLSRRELGAACGFASGTISKLEQGRPTRASTIRRVVRALAQVLEFDGHDVDERSLITEALALVGSDVAAESEHVEWFADAERRRDAKAVPPVILVARRDLRLAGDVVQDEITAARRERRMPDVEMVGRALRDLAAIGPPDDDRSALHRIADMLDPPGNEGVSEPSEGDR